MISRLQADVAAGEEEKRALEGALRAAREAEAALGAQMASMTIELDEFANLTTRLQSELERTQKREQQLLSVAAETEARIEADAAAIASLQADLANARTMLKEAARAPPTPMVVRPRSPATPLTPGYTPRMASSCLADELARSNEIAFTCARHSEV